MGQFRLPGRIHIIVAVMAFVAAGAVPRRGYAALITPIYSPYPIANLFNFYPAGVNNSGQVVTNSKTSNLDWNVVYTPGFGTTSVDPFPANIYNWTVGGINDAGVFVGVRTPANNSSGYVLYKYAGSGGAAAIQPLTIPANFIRADPSGINNAGQVVGVALLAGSVQHAYYHSGVAGDVAIDLSTLGSTFSHAYAINSSGVVVGDSALADGSDRAFLYSGAGPMMDLGVLAGATGSYARDVNDVGQIVGYAAVSGHNVAAYKPAGAGAWQALPVPADARQSQANSINNYGYIVGTVTGIGLNSSETYPVLWLNDANHTMINLEQWLDNTSPSEGSSWRLRGATAISESGYIVGWGLYTNNTDQPFLLNAGALVPEPASLAVLAVPALALVARRRR